MPRKRRPNVSTTDEILVRVTAPKRVGKFVLKWIDPDGRQRQQNTGIDAKRTLRRLAMEKGDELQERLNLEQLNGPAVDWDTFCRRYQQEHLSGLAEKTLESWTTADSHFRKYGKPGLLGSITADTLSRFVSGLRGRGIAETSVDSYLRTITVALSWAEEVELIARAPTLRRPRRSRGVNRSRRGRAPKREEVERMMAAALKHRKHDGEKFARLIDGLDKSGLRISEAIEELSWDWDSRFCVMLDGKYPMYKILAESEKGHTDRLLPIASEFVEWLKQVPEKKRRGLVFKMGLACSTVEKQLSRLGKKAGVVVSESGKFASAHDLRRSFGTRWARKVQPFVLQQLMRHKSIETTNKYYVELDAESVAKVLHEVENGGAYGGAPESGLSDEQLEQIVKELQVAIQQKVA